MLERNIIFEETFIVNEHSERRDGRPHCERHDGKPHSCSVDNYGHVGNYVHVGDYGHVSNYDHVGDYGHVGAKWLAPPSPMGDGACPHRGFPIPLNPSFRLRQTTSFVSVLSASPSFLSVLVGGGWCLNHCPLSHRRLRRYFATKSRAVLSL